MGERAGIPPGTALAINAPIKVSETVMVAGRDRSRIWESPETQVLQVCDGLLINRNHGRVDARGIVLDKYAFGEQQEVRGHNGARYFSGLTKVGPAASGWELREVAPRSNPSLQKLAS